MGARRERALSDATSAPSTQRVSRVLVVDDLPANLLAMEALIQELGFEPVLANSGSEALKRLLDQDVACVLLDLRMPGIDGLETAALIRKREIHKDLPILFVTSGEPTIEELSLGYSLGAVDFVHRPLASDILKSKIRALVRLYDRQPKEDGLSHELEIEDRVRKRTSALQATIEELRSFNHTLAHDLKGPLRAMVVFSELIKQDYAGKTLNGPGLEYLDKIRDVGLRMESMIQDLLLYARVSSADAAVETVDPNGLLQDVLIEMESDLAAAGALVERGELPSTLRANPLFLRQVLSNLLYNAIKFVDAGVKPRIRVGAERRGDFVRVWVRDNGVGIAPEHHANIFKIFERFDPSDKYPGTGIGLAIVQRAVERMGGRVGVESEPGKGSLFWFELRSREAPR
jgi:two-component system sensor histidine kinase/response regulator